MPASTPEPNAQPITLGELIDALAQAKPDDIVHFDFCNTVPDGVDSYRGYYDHLALGWKEESECTAGALLADLRAADGKVFQGYKGGDFCMYRETPMWVANYGRSGYTCVTGVIVHGYGYVTILTGYCAEWDGGMDRARKVLFGGLGYGNV